MRAKRMMFGAMIALVLLVAGCVGISSGPATPPFAETSPAVTTAPAATEAPGSTEAAPTPDPAAPPAAEAPAVSQEPQTTATVDAAVTAPPTTAPLPTAPPAPTASAAPPETPAPTAEPVAPTEPAAIACVPGALTPTQTEGPYYTANPPETNSLFQPGMNGTRLLLTGYVLDQACQPLPGARVDFWQADAAGVYDNTGYTLRGFTLTDAEGRYSMETVVPGEYPGRTPHIHVKVTPPGGATLTSQLYLPDAVANATDRIFSPALVVEIAQGADGLVGSFNFVVAGR